MSVMMIRVKRLGKSIIDDLRRLGFKQVNVVSFCYGKAMAIAHDNFGIKNADVVVSNIDDASILVDVFKKNGMYISHNVVENSASDSLISVERNKCEIVS